MNSTARETSVCPFGNLPEVRAGPWGDGLPATKMKNCRWLKAVLVGQFEFVGWTPVGLRKDTAHAMGAPNRTWKFRKSNRP
jgi:hypothetical protein